MTLSEDLHTNLITPVQIRVIEYKANAEQDTIRDQELESFWEDTGRFLQPQSEKLR